MTSPAELEVNQSQQLDRVFAQLQKLLKQREDLLALRKASTERPPEASPEEHLDRMKLLRSERGRQRGMQGLTDKLSELGDRLLTRLTPSDAQLEMQQSLKDQLGEVKLLERLQEQREETMEQTLREVLTEVAQAHPPTSLQQRMLQVAEKVQQLTNEMQQPSSVSAPVPASPAKAASGKGTEQEAAQLAALTYEQARIEARQDTTAQDEAVAMAKELGYEPSRLADAIQGYSGLGSAVVAAAASLHPLGAQGRKSASATAAPRASASANGAKASPAKASSTRRSR
ncbi:hypothetical protein [Streptomyces sp. OM5714]|uniref:hypothetical protein n=1 Tax=Streptomyces sp. OM5714 TaxID=2602736 RepID=UPI0013DB00E9|nr:hypothetical protein [Streptomyces sp. OM5714]